MKNKPIILSKTDGFGAIAVPCSFLSKFTSPQLILSGIGTFIGSNSRMIGVLVMEVIFLDVLATTASSSDIEITSTMLSIRPDTADEIFEFCTHLFKSGSFDSS